MKAFFGGVIGGILAIAGAGILLFLQSILAVVLGWLFGIFAVWVFGGFVPDAINTVFGTALTVDTLPKATAAIWFLGSLIGLRKPNIKTTTGKQPNSPKITINGR